MKFCKKRVIHLLARVYATVEEHFALSTTRVSPRPSLGLAIGADPRTHLLLRAVPSAEDLLLILAAETSNRLQLVAGLARAVMTKIL